MGGSRNERKGSEGAWNSAWRYELSNHNGQRGSEASDGCSVEVREGDQIRRTSGRGDDKWEGKDTTGALAKVGRSLGLGVL